MTIYKKALRKKYVKRAKPRKKSGVSTTRTIKKVVNRMAETKIQSIDGTTNLCAYNGTNWDTSNSFPVNIYPAWLTIAQGTGQGGRIGDRVTIHNLKMTIILTPKPYNVSTNPAPVPQMIKMFLVNGKLNTLYNVRPTQALTVQFFQAGDSSQPPVGNLFDMINEPNTDLFNVYATKTFKLGYSTAGGNGAQAGPQYYSNNDYKMNHLIKWNLTKHIPKLLHFNDTGSSPTSRSLFMMVLICNADGSTPAVGTTSATLDYEIVMKYKDL